MFEKEVTSYLLNVAQDVLDALEKDVQKRASRLMRSKVVVPVELLIKRLLLAFMAAASFAFGLLLLAFGAIIWFNQQIPLWKSLLISGGFLALIGVIFGLLLATSKKPVDALQEN